jgi:GNAT superfamily N-acetyltransferase
VELRPTTDADFPAMHAIFLVATGELFRRHGFEPPAPSLEAYTSQQLHLLRTGVSYVAEADDALLGYSSAWTRGEDWFLASLFVAPSAQGSGVGSALFDAVWGDARRRRTITDAIQPVSNALYARRGLIPTTPVLTFTGMPRMDTPALDEAHADVAALDEAAYGFDRAPDHALWSQVARRTTWGDAYSYVFPSGDIGPVVGATPPAAALALAAELARATSPVRVRVLGSAPELVEVALHAQLRLGAVPGLLLCSRGAAAPTALAPSGYLLF